MICFAGGVFADIFPTVVLAALYESITKANCWNVKKLIPNGKSMFFRAYDVLNAAFMFSIKKSVYLKYPKSPMLKRMPIVSIVFSFNRLPPRFSAIPMP